MSGSGRGRAWLRLGQNAAVVRPGIDSSPNDSVQALPLPEEKGKTTTNNYNDLVDKFQLLSVDDDGIAVNNKIYHIRSEFMKKCPNINLISEAVETIHEQCLVNEEFSEKFLLFITSAHFQNKQKSEEQLLWRNTVKRTFITLLQNDFEAGEQNREKFPTKFFGSAKLCSDYFYMYSKFLSQAYSSLEKISTLGYLKILLKYDTPADIMMISYLICRHSSVILSLLNDENCMEYKEILNKLKLMIISGSSIPEAQRFRLFFTYELLNQKYKLTDDQLEFYKDNVDDVDFLGILGMLASIPQFDVLNESNSRRKTEEKIIHNSESNVVKKFPQQVALQSSKSSEENTSCSTSEDLEFRIGTPRDQFNYKASDLDTRSREGYFVPNKKETWKDLQSDGLNTQERIGRPILGVGARLKKM